MEVLITSKGSKEIADRFERFDRNITEAKMAMGLVGKEIEDYNKKNWGHGVKDAPTTDLRWPGHGKLVNPQAAAASGNPELKDTFKVLELTPTSVTYGSKDYRARFLQYGTKKMKKKRVLKFPRRKIALLLQKLIFDGFSH